MKKRYILYGYKMENGEIVINPKESETVRECFRMYIEGNSFLTIAEDLAAKKTEYLEGKWDWNKNRVKRIIQEKRYLGDEQYAPIINGSVFDKAQKCIDNRNKYLPTWSEEIGIIKEKVRCECGHSIKRRTTKNHKVCKWLCSKCGTKIYIADDELVKICLKLLNQIITEPSLIFNHPEDQQYNSELENKRELKKIETLVLQNSDIELILEEILQNAAEKYNRIKYPKFIDQKLRAVIAEAKPLSVFNKELFLEVVSDVIIGSEIRLRLINGVVIQKK